MIGLPRRLAAGSPWLAVAFVLAALPAPAAEPEPANDPEVREVARQLACYCGCNTQSLAECTCGVARSSREEIQASLASGDSPEEVVAAWVDRFGPRILLEPPRRGFHLLGWFLPPVALVVGALLLVLVIRRWSHAPAAPPERVGPSDPRYVEQLESELKQMKP